MKKYTCLYYWLVETIRNKFLDTSESLPAFEIPIESDFGTCEFAVFVSDDGKPEYARLTIPNLVKEKIPSEMLPMIQAVKEHFLSILRITYYSDATLFPRPIWTFQEDPTSYTMGLEIRQFTNRFFDIDRTKQLFIGGFPYREEIRLFIDGHDHRIPLQYRYLSLYKIIELHYKKQGIWQEDKLDTLLSKYSTSFTEIAGSKKPANHIHMLRDKCAHIKTGSSKEVLGVTHLNHKEAATVEKTMPILSDICIEILNERTDGKFVIMKRDMLSEGST